MREEWKRAREERGVEKGREKGKGKGKREARKEKEGDNTSTSCNLKDKKTTRKKIASLTLPKS